jgi:hypothetical protein
MLDTRELERRIEAQRLRQEVDDAAAACEIAAQRFATYPSVTVEEQLAIELAFWDARMRLGELSQRLLRLTCCTALALPRA